MSEQRNFLVEKFFERSGNLIKIRESSPTYYKRRKRKKLSEKSFETQKKKNFCFFNSPDHQFLFKSLRRQDLYLTLI